VTTLELLKLSWEIQVALGSGYVAYAVAYTGLRDRQRAIDVAFISLVFSLIATLVLWLLSSYGRPVVASAAAVLASLVSGIIWRKAIRPWVLEILRKFDVTWADDEPSALTTLSGNTKYRVSQVAVLLDDGDWLCCDETRRFSDSPFGPFQLGPSGDIALYVTTIIPREGEPRDQSTLRDARYGDRITYVAASRIKQITFRHLPKANRSLPAAAVPAAQSQPEQAAPSAAP
jgi:hypothetical protein